MRLLLSWAVGLLLTGALHAQNDVQYSQFVFNKLAINPAYAGSREALTVGAIYRNQWTGVEGAPTTVSAYMHAPFANKRNGLGLAVTADRIGIMDNTYLDASYAYRIAVGIEKTLSIGLRARFEHTNINYQLAELIDPQDGFVPQQAERDNRTNFGFGAYYQERKWFVGVSIPNLLKSNLYTEEYFGRSDYKRFRSSYLIAGMIHELSEDVLLKPALMVSYSPNAPFEVDFNASLRFLEVLWVGASYRLGDSVDGIVQYQFSDQFKAGFAVDFTLTELQQYTSGTFEVLVEYTWLKERQDVNNIRFF